jgi:hypothetical protein
MKKILHKLQHIFGSNAGIITHKDVNGESYLGFMCNCGKFYKWEKVLKANP